MTIRHPGRWLISAAFLFIAITWIAEKALNAKGLGQSIWLLGAILAVGSLFSGAHRRGAYPSIFTIAATLAAGSAAMWIDLRFEAKWWVRILLLGFLAGPLMSIANALYRADIRRAQRGREAHASAITDAVLSGQPVRPYALYLRPFVTTNRLSAQALPSMNSPMEVPVHLDAETLLTRSLRGIMPLIALGRAGEVDEGVARITSR